MKGRTRVNHLYFGRKASKRGDPAIDRVDGALKDLGLIIVAEVGSVAFPQQLFVGRRHRFEEPPGGVGQGAVVAVDHEIGFGEGASG